MKKVISVPPENRKQQQQQTFYGFLYRKSFQTIWQEQDKQTNIQLLPREFVFLGTQKSLANDNMHGYNGEVMYCPYF